MQDFIDELMDLNPEQVNMTDQDRDFQKKIDELSIYLELLRGTFIHNLDNITSLQTETYIYEEDRDECYELLVDWTDASIDQINYIQTEIETLQNEITKHYDELTSGIVISFRKQLEDVSYEVAMIVKLLDRYVLDKLPNR